MPKTFAFAAILTMLVASAAPSSAQTMADDLFPLFNEWKSDFSSEGIKSWHPEFTLRYFNGLITSGPALTGGARIDNKRTLGLMLSRRATYYDAAPGEIYSIATSLFFRRYFHLGKRDIFAFYSDLSVGAGWVYRVNGKYRTYTETGEKTELIDESPGDVLFVGEWQAGIRIRFYRNLHLFLGPTLATDCLGLHLGIGF